jgi:hypothetical protein
MEAPTHPQYKLNGASGKYRARLASGSLASSASPPTLTAPPSVMNGMKYNYNQNEKDRHSKGPQTGDNNLVIENIDFEDDINVSDPPQLSPQDR